MASRGAYQVPMPKDNPELYRSFGDLAHEDSSALNVPWIPSALSRYIHPDVGLDLTPDALAAIFQQANQGQSEIQNKLAVEIVERNPEVYSCLQVRVGAVTGVEWHCEGDHAEEAVEMLKSVPGNAEMGLLDFHTLVESSVGNSILPGFACHEICWRPGGSEIEGFYFLPAYYFSHRFFPGGTSFNAPLLIREHQGFIRQAERLEPKEKWIVHRSLLRGGDPARGGLVRPLSWIHLFWINIMKFGMRYVEKFVDPTLIAQVAFADKTAFEEEVRKLKVMLSNQGSDMAIITSNNTTITAQEIAGTGNAIYGQMLSTLSAMINRLVLGQTSTTTAENSNRSVGQVHNLVRHDILEADCYALETSINESILTPWTKFTYGEGVKAPRLKFLCTPYKDAEMVAGLLKDLSAAGLEAEDLDEVSRIVGIKVKKSEKKELQPAMVGEDEEEAYGDKEPTK
jgi:phage gp29-like protein